MLVLDWIEKLGNLINAPQDFAKQDTLATQQSSLSTPASSGSEESSRCRAVAVSEDRL